MPPPVDVARRPVEAAAMAPPSNRVRWAWWAGVAAIAIAALGRLEPLDATGLSADVGLQYYLAQLTAEGAVPVRDFAHGWNVLGWYQVAFFYVLAGGQHSLWAWLWGTVGGRLLAGVVLLTIARRHGLPAPWLLGLTALLLLVQDVPNAKYALPALWLFALLPGRRLDGPRSALVVRGLLAGVMVLTHIELAVMLCLGTGLYDLLGARGLPLRQRVARVAALGAGLAVAFGAQLTLYSSLGVPPGELIRFLVLDRAGVSSAATAFDYSLLQPATLLGAAYPASLVLAFVPAVWRRLSDTTRLVAALHLGLGLIAIRKPDEGHLGAASVLLAALLALGAYDLTRSRWPRLGRPRTPAPALFAAAGAGWLLVTVGAGFGAGSVLALPVLVGLTAFGAVAALRYELPWASGGAVAAGAALTVLSAASLSVAEARGPQDDLQARTMAEALQPAVDRCLGGDRRAWIVAEPLTLYDTLSLNNPTPYYLFWPGFVDEADEVLARMADGEIPAVLQVGGWPASMARVAPVVESSYRLCAEVDTPAVPEEGIGAQTVRVWVDR